jgi:hypothetical protein
VGNPMTPESSAPMSLDSSVESKDDIPQVVTRTPANEMPIKASCRSCGRLLHFTNAREAEAHHGHACSFPRGLESAASAGKVRTVRLSVLLNAV